MMLVDILLVDTFNACQHYPYETRKEKKWKPEYILSFYFYYISLLIPENKLYPKWNTHTILEQKRTVNRVLVGSVSVVFSMSMHLWNIPELVKKVWYTCIYDDDDDCCWRQRFSPAYSNFVFFLNFWIDTDIKLYFEMWQI